MPIEIKELIIRAQVGGANKSTSATASGPAEKPATEELVMESIEQVLEIMNNKKER